MDKEVNFYFARLNKLNDFNLLSIYSFHKLGYTCVMWCYEEIINLPEYVIVKDANEIIPYNGNTYVAFLSDEFRMLLLNKYGGLYSDLDNIILKSLPETEYILAGRHSNTINSVIRTPINSELTNYLVDNREIINNNVKLHQKIVDFNLDKWVIPVRDINYFNGDLKELVTKEIDWSKVESYMVHLFQSMHRVCYKSSDVYNLNMANLKKFVEEQ
jgi:hypothetical protein